MQLNRVWFFKHRTLLLAGGALLVVTLYVWITSFGAGVGFPLDDGWIHQTYARNLARTGRWEYTPGVISAGSTAPLWTVWLTLGYVVKVPFLLWAHATGAILLAWTAISSQQLWQQLWPQFADKDWVAGLTVLLTWPLIWAAGSGMETLLFIALGLQLLIWFYRWQSSPTWGQALRLGVGAGLLILVRPDGVVLLMLLSLGMLTIAFRRPVARRDLLLFGVTVALTLLPYFLFNRWASGQFWPNTLYAKQAEYAELLVRPLPLRFAELLFYSLGGPPAGWRGISSAHLLLLPGLVAAGWQAAQRDWSERQLAVTLPLWWAGGHLLLYAWRLPVTYQHGRYLFAAIPVWILFGLAGWQPLLETLQTRLRPLYRQVAVLSFAVIVAFFWLLGLQAYLFDVTFIQREMVATAHWLNDNTPDDAIIASHDIGAIGYFTERTIVDLAGLITPELVPYLRDEPALAAYVVEQRTDFLVTAPGWEYQELLANLPGPVERYSSNFEWTRLQAVNNMTVYELP